MFLGQLTSRPTSPDPYAYVDNIVEMQAVTMNNLEAFTCLKEFPHQPYNLLLSSGREFKQQLFRGRYFNHARADENDQQVSVTSSRHYKLS